jgi:DNA repair exonuclease SbcCD ATPase subunit
MPLGGGRMKNLEIKYASAKNFLCFGKDPIEIEFAERGGVTLVKGLNLDVSDGESNASSNGAGKSSIPEIIVYTLFGKTIKHPKKIGHRDVINNAIGKGLRTEVRWGDYRVVRTRKPDSLKLWESPEGVWDESTEITLGGQPATQKLIEEKIGLNYETFVNVVVFTDNNAGSFLECDAAGKREIVENLLSLEKYKGFAEAAKELKKEKKDEIRIAESELDSLKRQKEQSESRLKAAKSQEDSWRSKAEMEIDQIKARILQKKKEMSETSASLSSSKYHEAVSRISDINSELPAMEDKRQRVESILEKANERMECQRREHGDRVMEARRAESEAAEIESRAKDHEREVRRLEESEGGTCKYCFGKVSKENFGKYRDQMMEKVSAMRSEAESIMSKKSVSDLEAKSVEGKMTATSKAVAEAKKSLADISASIRSLRSELAELEKVERPASEDARTSVLEGQIGELTTLLAEKNKSIEGDTPFKSIIESLREETESKDSEIESKAVELESLERNLPYYDFWQIGFGDSGIRKFVIDGIIPALNARIAHWLQFLIDGKITLEFDNSLEEIIQRNPPDGDPFVYHAMSGGERRRLNLAVSQAFAHVMMLNSGTYPSLVFLDEVTTNIDQMGVVGVYNMIMELAKDRQVFVTTHDQNLLDMLDGCELITLEKRGGFTRLKN